MNPTPAPAPAPVPPPQNGSAAAGPRPQSSPSTPVPDTLLRILVPSSSSINSQRHATPSARIHLDPPSSDFRVAYVAGDPRRSDGDPGFSPLQKALLGLFEDSESGKDDASAACCRMLAPSGQVGCVLGKGGKIVERLRAESGAQIRVLKKEHRPQCVGPGDELICISGKYAAVKKALISVSSCLQDYPRQELVNIMNAKGLGLGPTVHGSLGPETTVAGSRFIVEQEVMIRMLCPNEKVAVIIGKGGTTIRALQSETGASVKIADPISESEERLIVIASRECPEMMHSPAQEALLRLYSLLSGVSMDKGIVYPARLLMPSHQISYLLGQGGNTISEVRKRTGADIRIFVREQVPRFAQSNDELVQVTGSFQSVQDALYQIANIIRESIFPVKQHSVSVVTDKRPPMQHGTDSTCVDRLHHSYGMVGVRPVVDHISPRTWAAEVTRHGMPISTVDAGNALEVENGGYGANPSSGENHKLSTTNATTEVMVPAQYLQYINGDNGSDLAELRKMSGSTITVHDPKPGEEHVVKVTICGNPEQTKLAQSLLQAFILCGLYPST